jgi:glutamate-5-semialdehyde dehydrogenase
MALIDDMTELARRAKEASRELARLSADDKNRCLRAMADGLIAATPGLLAANAQDLEVGKSLGLTGAMMDRLALNTDRITAMAQGLREVAALPDALGRVLDTRERPNGLRLRKITTPIGVVVIIYESRPNVTADAASLCFKTGNATILRGGKEALNSNRLIAETLIASAKAVLPHFPEHAIQVVPTADREAIPALLSLTQYVDLCMPRGGEGLIRAVTECSKVPVIKHYKGVCHVYVHAAADLAMAEEIVFNAKCQRPSTCNAAETVLVDRAVAGAFLPRMAARLATKSVEFHADAESLPSIAKAIGGTSSVARAAQAKDWETEYNNYILNVAVVDGVASAIHHIHRHGSGHSEAIITAEAAVAERFLAEVDSAAVYWNASTRFTDGGEYGMGAEIGISTDKVGARGPMGLDELCSYKWQGFGTGQVRA